MNETWERDTDITSIADFFQNTLFYFQHYFSILGLLFRKMDLRYYGALNFTSIASIVWFTTPRDSIFLCYGGKLDIPQIVSDENFCLKFACILSNKTHCLFVHKVIVTYHWLEYFYFIFCKRRFSIMFYLTEYYRPEVKPIINTLLK